MARIDEMECPLWLWKTHSRRLPDKQHKVVGLFYGYITKEPCTLDEIAGLMDRTKTYVRTLLDGGVRHLWTLYKDSPAGGRVCHNGSLTHYREHPMGNDCTNVAAWEQNRHRNLASPARRLCEECYRRHCAKGWSVSKWHRIDQE